MIKLYKNNAYQWFKFKNVYTIGYAFYNNHLYKDNELTNLVLQLKDNIEQVVKNLGGYFAIVIQEEKQITLVSDIIRSFPVFYNERGDVTDDIELLKGDIDELSIKELLQARWVSGEETIYKNVKQLENASIVYIYKNGKIQKKKYFKCKHIYNTSYSFEELDTVFQKMTDRLIMYLNGKTAVIPLSGGGDSRLLAYYLKKSGYPSIITYTYGNDNLGEVETSKKVAEFLKLPWHFVEYKRKECKMIYNNNKKRYNIMNYLGRGYSIPLIQELEAINQLFNSKIIDKDCIIIPGFTLDFLAGSHLYSEFMTECDIDSQLVIEMIYKNNYNLTKNNNNIFNEKLEKLLSIESGKINPNIGLDLYEKYDFEERQAKFINNAIRVYDYYGIKWYLPFWDKDVIGFWSKVSMEDRYQRKFLIEFAHYKYGELMNYAPLWHKNESKINKFKKVGLIWHNYFNNPLNYYYYFGFKKYLKYVLTERNFNYDYYSAKDYVKYIRKNNKKYKEKEENGI